MSVRCLILDGDHSGHLMSFPYHPPVEIKIPKVNKITTLMTQLDESVISKTLPDYYVYFLAATGRKDSDIWLYSTDGTLMSLITDKTWICPNKEHKNYKTELWLYSNNRKEIFFHGDKEIQSV